MVYAVKRFSSGSNNSREPRERDPLPVRFIDYPEYRGASDITWNVEYNSKVNQQMSGLSALTKKRIKSLKKSLEDGYVYSDNPKNDHEKTHYLSRFSNPKRYHRLTKNVNGSDRFDYIVYPPESFLIPKTNEKVLVSKIVVQSVVGHFDWKNERIYSNSEDDAI